MTSPHGLIVVPRSPRGGLLTNCLNMYPFDYTTFVVRGQMDPVNPFNHISWLAEFTQTVLSKSVRNRCVLVIEVLVVSSCCLLTFIF